MGDRERWNLINKIYYRPEGVIQLSELTENPLPYDRAKDSSVVYNSTVRDFLREAERVERNREILAEIQEKLFQEAPQLR